jgi:hypothetical protein
MKAMEACDRNVMVQSQGAAVHNMEAYVEMEA